jgi:hypothetical protein
MKATSFRVGYFYNPTCSGLGIPAEELLQPVQLFSSDKGDKIRGKWHLYPPNQ